MSLLLIAFLSGILTVLSPCVLPILPIILGASAQERGNKSIPIVVISSLMVSIFIFSFLLKVSTLLIDIPPSFWKFVSGGILIVLGFFTIFPNLWSILTDRAGYTRKTQNILHNSDQKTGWTKYILLGMSLGPIFSSCSPMYALILAIILPASLSFGLLALGVYVLGLGFILTLIAIGGQKILQSFRFLSDPKGYIKRGLGIIFLLVGISIVSGFDKVIETRFLDMGVVNTTEFEQKIIDSIDVSDFDTNTNGYIGGQCSNGSCEKSVSGSLDFLRPENILDPGELSEAGYGAPNIGGLTGWINSEGIENLSELHGKVVLIKFWTLGCINCIASHQETQELYDEFSPQGLEIIGVHTPEFQYEKKLGAFQKAIEKYDINYPVAQDNDFTTWKRFNNRYWPSYYIIDTRGQVRYTHFGEGGHDKMKEVIKKLLRENI